MGVPKGLTLPLHGAGHHLPDRSPELDASRGSKNARPAAGGQADFLEVWTPC